MKRIYLGVDTSNYTTSVAAADEDGNILLNLKKLLPVAHGERGLRQSDTVFLHTKAIPELLSQAKGILGDDRGYSIEGVGYSSAPRDVEGSYMPCFLVGESVANSLSFASGASVYSFSHQAGHIMAALYSANAMHLCEDCFAAFHVSGGTTELLVVSPDENKIISVEKAGGTLDISAGQLIDRIGVKAGFDFPAGKYVDEAAMRYSGDADRVRVNVSGLDCNFSGAENQALRILEGSNDIDRTSKFVMEFVATTIRELSLGIRARYPEIPILYSGGVMSSEYIKRKLAPLNGFHAAPDYSSDNAAGCALLTLKKHLKGGMR